MINAGLAVDVQNASGSQSVPEPRRIKNWVIHALSREVLGEITVRVVAEAEGSHLNEVYRHGVGSTNVLAFPTEIATLDLVADVLPLGDIVICAPVIEREADLQGIELDAHWAHMVIHGVLHLMGFDHQTSEDAVIMEAREKELLEGLGFKNLFYET
jgi:probable rRNA maturation factor